MNEGLYPRARYLIVGDQCVTVEFGSEVTDEINTRVRKMCRALGEARVPGVAEFFAAFRSLSVFYNPLETRAQDLVRELRKIEGSLGGISLPAPNTFEIPVLYGGEDLDRASGFLKLSREELIAAHCAPAYTVYMNGALGGTAFIRMPERLASLPRKKTPALWVAAGVVMVAGGLGSLFKAMGGPSGWNVIGKSPLRQWFPEKDPPLLIVAGDRVKYRPVDEKEYEEIKAMVAEGAYRP
ncbi:MAG TPA: carboxyltransferase domain-containing protein, partial [Thermodesulfobacteriota bacterium]|nr:carboxyltransferase domain-containing protein [Thermodesulfobacteriota bacterium]